MDTAKYFGRILYHRARDQKIEPVHIGGSYRLVQRGVAGQYTGQPDVIRCFEDIVLIVLAEIGIQNEGFLVGLGHGDGQITDKR